jgi:hypothetical protein
MALPLIPFAAGIAVGSLATYAATDKALHQRLTGLADAALAKVRAGAEQVAAVLPKLGEQAKETVMGAAEAVQDGAEGVSAKARAVVDEAMQKAKRSAVEAADAVEKGTTPT